MKFGVSFLPDAYPEVKSPAQYYADALDTVELIDRLGFHSVKITEHFFHPYGGYCGNPMVFLTAAAMRSQHLRLIPGCVLPVFHNPFNVASEFAMLDAISGGRAEMGFARAYLPHEFATFGVPIDESRPRFIEFIDAILRLWTEEKASFSGRYHHFENVTSLPPLVQKPLPPIWIAASATPESFRWAGERGYNLMVAPILADPDQLKQNVALYREAFREAGHGTPGPDNFTAVYPVFVHEDRDKAHELGKKYVKRMWKVWYDAARAWNNVQTKQYNYTGMGWYMRTFTYQRLVDEGRVLIGTPDDVAERIQALRDSLGLEYLTIQPDFGAMEYEWSKPSIQLFAEAVMPRFAETAVTPAAPPQRAGSAVAADANR